MAYVEVISESDVRRIAIEEIELRASAPWLTAATAAAHLAMSEDAVRSMVKRGQLPVHRLRTAAFDLDRLSSTPGLAERGHDRLLDG